jgi:hypothetical protein
LHENEEWQWTPNDKEVEVFRNRIVLVSTERPGRPDERADELTATTNAAWSRSARKRRRIAAELIRRRLTNRERPNDRGSQTT